MLSIDDFVFFLKCIQTSDFFSNLLTHRFQRHGPLENIAKQEKFKGLLGMTKLYCQLLVGYWPLGLWNFFLEDSGCFIISYFMHREDGLINIYLENVQRVESF